jgi:hypothetical protein
MARGDEIEARSTRGSAGATTSKSPGNLEKHLLLSWTAVF